MVEEEEELLKAVRETLGAKRVICVASRYHMASNVLETPQHVCGLLRRLWATAHSSSQFTGFLRHGV